MVNARYAASLVRFFFGELHHGVMHLCCDSSLAGRIFGELHIGCNISLVYCIFGVLYHWWIVSRVKYIFGVASLVLCIVSYIAKACYRSCSSTLYNPQGTGKNRT